MLAASTLHPIGSSHYAMFVVLPLLAWRFHVRFRRMVGRQRLSRVRPWITATAFPLLVVALGYASRSDPNLVWCLGGGVFTGVFLGAFGIRKTKFEATPEGLFYTPNAHLGIALSLVFATRVLFRLLSGPGPHPPTEPGAFHLAASPLTSAIFGLLAGYYVSYAIGLVRWGRRASHDRPSPEQSTPSTLP